MSKPPLGPAIIAAVLTFVLEVIESPFRCWARAADVFHLNRCPKCRAAALAYLESENAPPE
jgi:hypothetical protein